MDYINFVILAMSISMLVIILVIFGVMLSTKKSNFVFPNIQNQCPDSWPIVGDGCMYIPNGVEDLINRETDGKHRYYLDNYEKIKQILERAKNTGKNNGTLHTLEDLLQSRTPLGSREHIWNIQDGLQGIRFNENATLCDKQQWANFYGIKWDGITNFNHCL